MRYSFQLGAQVRKIISVHSRSTPPVAVNVVDGRKGERAFIMEPLNSVQKWNYAINQCRVLLLGCICLKTSFFFYIHALVLQNVMGFFNGRKTPRDEGHKRDTYSHLSERIGASQQLFMLLAAIDTSCKKKRCSCNSIFTSTYKTESFRLPTKNNLFGIVLGSS